MNTLNFDVNGERVTIPTHPRTMLADLVREDLGLTGTHLGCEQGVCGACTILVDGVPVRSCISNASACDGATLRTIEGFDNDPVMVELRLAFNEHHALQCGFCTPGMLIMARDIVTRLDDPDEQRVRMELAGNLCRCTGYAGIVKAILSVVAARRARGLQPEAAELTTFGPAGSGHARSLPPTVSTAYTPTSSRPKPDAIARPARSSAGNLKDSKREPAVKQSVTVSAPAHVVWERFGDVPAMIRCIPGATLLAEDPDGSYQVRIRVKLGPVGAEFSGTATQERDNAVRTGIIHGEGRDTRTATLAAGELTYRVSESPDGGTRIAIEVSYALSGALAQFARAGIVTHFIAAITKQFATNLERTITGGDDTAISNELRVAGTFWAALRIWAGDVFRRFGGR